MAGGNDAAGMAGKELVLQHPRRCHRVGLLPLLCRTAVSTHTRRPSLLNVRSKRPGAPPPSEASCAFFQRRQAIPVRSRLWESLEGEDGAYRERDRSFFLTISLHYAPTRHPLRGRARHRCAVTMRVHGRASRAFTLTSAVPILTVSRWRVKCNLIANR